MGNIYNTKMSESAKMQDWFKYILYISKQFKRLGRWLKCFLKVICIDKTYKQAKVKDKHTKTNEKLITKHTKTTRG